MKIKRRIKTNVGATYKEVTENKGGKIEKNVL